MLASIFTKTFTRSGGFIALLCTALLLGAPTASAQSLNDLRASGQVGESHTGYAHARDANVQSIVDSINAKRHKIYSDRAAQQGISPAQVGKVYADQIIAKSPAGTWLLTPSGSWRQK